MKDIVRHAMAGVERDLILRALRRTENNVTHAARRLKISRKSLQIKMKELGIRDELLRAKKTPAWIKSDWRRCLVLFDDFGKFLENLAF